ncbi:MAG TPA: MarR family winged helix-turn-helix transcriptional regulator [Labilithrix sp.]|nr:MarR family winged helix-turn-helix transcriptional regulator [Labilithrix sp.]
MRDQFTGDGITLDKALAYWIHRVYQAERNEMFRELRQHGEELTPEQWIVLVRLWEEDGRTQTDLGASTFRDRPTMSRILDGMEKRGVLERRADPDDARVWRIYLTAQGKALRKKLVPSARHLVERAQRGIPERDLVTTRETLIQMFANLTQG